MPINYLTMAKASALCIDNGTMTVSDVKASIITGLAKGVIVGTYIFSDIPEVLQDTVKAKILEIDSTYNF